MAIMFSEDVCDNCYSNFCFIEMLDFVKVFFQIFTVVVVNFFPDFFEISSGAILIILKSRRGLFFKCRCHVM